MRPQFILETLILSVYEHLSTSAANGAGLQHSYSNSVRNVAKLHLGVDGSNVSRLTRGIHFGGNPSS